MNGLTDPVSPEQKAARKAQPITAEQAVRLWTTKAQPLIQAIEELEGRIEVLEAEAKSRKQTKSGLLLPEHLT